MNTLNATHDPSLRSWVPTDPSSPFPIQNLPFGVFRRRGGNDVFRGGVAIGDRIVDLPAWSALGAFNGLAAEAAAACAGPVLNPLLALGPSHWSALRGALSALLAERAERPRLAEALIPMAEAEVALPVRPENYSDFFCSLEHAMNAGRVMRNDASVNANFRWMPVAYHGRPSSLRVSGTPCVRPMGQVQAAPGEPPVFVPTRRLDYECELAAIVGPGNALGERIPLSRAESHLFGLCLMNDWSARDVQRFEYQPLGPFLGKSFLTSLSPWIVTLEALAPFRVPARPRQGTEEPPPLPHLSDPANEAAGGLDIAVSATISSPSMREHGAAPTVVGRGNARWLYWTFAQMLAHHTSNGCNLLPGDVLGSGTISGFEPGTRGCLLEASEGGKVPLPLPGNETRTFLEDGDEMVLSAWCRGEGAASIGFGECSGTVMPSAEAD
ncbi:fumarylacetoacetase [Muricoccus radiodurans]|uniref:fumarylacetoacetase n=1 Tax=Muricoccus radiodurans TaxID=2231721 RepID=UPI003CEDD2A8